MEPSTLIALISLSGVVGKALFDYYKNKKLDSASANKTNEEAKTVEYDRAISLVHTLEERISIQKNEIDDLYKQLKELKENEGTHLLEKVKLEAKVELLIGENTSLRREVESNKIMYETKIEELGKEIESLKKLIKK